MTSSSCASCFTHRRRQRVVARRGRRRGTARRGTERRLAAGHREAREAVALEAEVDRARARQLDRRSRCPPPTRARIADRSGARRQREQLVAGLEVVLAVGPRRWAQLLERRPWRIPTSTSWSSRSSGMRVVHVVGDDDRQPELRRRGARSRRRASRRRAAGGAASSTKKPAPAAEPPAAPEPNQRGVALRHRPRALAIAGQQPPRDLAVAAARERDEALGVRGEQRMGEPGHGLGAREVGPADEPRERGSDSRPRPGRAARGAGPRCASPTPRRSSLTDARWPGSRARRGRGRAGSPSACRSGWRRRAPDRRAGSGRRRRDDDPGRIRHRRVEQLDLHPDDRPEARFLGRRGEADRAVETLVVGDGERLPAPARRRARPARRAPKRRRATRSGYGNGARRTASP